MAPPQSGPPTRSRASSTRTFLPALARYAAQANPLCPAPTTITSQSAAASSRTGAGRPIFPSTEAADACISLLNHGCHRKSEFETHPSTLRPMRRLLMSRRRKRWLYAIGGITAAVVISMAIAVSVLARRFEPFLRDQAVAYLSDRFHCDVGTRLTQGPLAQTFPFEHSAGTRQRRFGAGGRNRHFDALSGFPRPSPFYLRSKNSISRSISALCLRT